MLYHLLYPLRGQISWLNVFQYTTFRALLAFLVAFVLVLLVQPYFIGWLKSRGVKGQPIREEGPKDHFSKKGTPTMGGLVIVFAVMLSTVLLCDLTNHFVWIVVTVLLGYATLGFFDDWRKVTKQNTRGVTGRVKLAWQTGLVALAVIVLWMTGFEMSVTVPFFKNATLPLGLLLFLPFACLVVVGTSNAVNLTDGLDGLAIGPVMTVAGTFALFTYVAGVAGRGGIAVAGSQTLASYLSVTAVPGAQEISVTLSAVVGAGLGFLWYNTFPAQIFMGDTGSLALGGILGISAIISKHELLLLIAGGIFVLEAVSVIVQVYSFKLTGRRVFRMAPIHHHFELKGWPEPRIIVRFWIISIVLAVISLTSLKLR